MTGSCVLRETILGAVRGWSARFSIYLSIYLSLGQDPVPAGHVRAVSGHTQLPLRNLGTHYIALGGSEHAGGASRVSFTDPDRSLFSRAPRRSARHNAWMDGALRPTRLID